MNSSRPNAAGVLRAGALFVCLLLVLTMLSAGRALAGHGDCGLSLSPASATNTLGDPHGVTVSLVAPVDQTVDQCRGEGGTQIAIELTGDAGAIYAARTAVDAESTPQSPDLWCRIAETATACTVAYTRRSPVGTDTISAFFAEAGTAREPDAQATKQWRLAATDATRLDCEPETATGPIGGTHSIVCTATDDAGRVVRDAEVDAEVTGANDPDVGRSFASPDLGCTTGPDGTCVLVHDTAGADLQDLGTTIYRAWIDLDPNDGSGGPDAAEARDEIRSPGSLPQPDHTDVVSHTWIRPGLSCAGFETDPRHQIVGTLGDDVLRGTEGVEIICGRGGNDSIAGLGGIDLILGEAGNDTLAGNEGADTLLGGTGSDVLSGATGADALRGGTGSDVLLGGANGDMLRGEIGDDVLRGQGGPDVLVGGDGDDVLNGGSSPDRCEPGRGRDTIRAC